MSHSNFKTDKLQIESLVDFVNSTQGLRLRISDSATGYIIQDVDKKMFRFLFNDVLEVLKRKDSDGKSFLQINFLNNKKVLVTDSLIGFKPEVILGLDMTKIPKVVTTPDLQSVYEAIEESMSTEGHSPELEILKKVYVSILGGAEQAGFSLESEKSWINRLMASRIIASA